LKARKRGALLLGKTWVESSKKAKLSLLDGIFDGICFIALFKKKAIQIT
jgi:hypothetical protein